MVCAVIIVCVCVYVRCVQIIASGLLSQRAVVLSAADGNFHTLRLSECMKASMRIPGVAGDVVRLKVGWLAVISTVRVHVKRQVLAALLPILF